MPDQLLACALLALIAVVMVRTGTTTSIERQPAHIVCIRSRRRSPLRSTRLELAIATGASIVLLIAMFSLVVAPLSRASWVDQLGASGSVQTANTFAATATLDLDPDTLNPHSNGKWITAYVEFPPGLPPGCTLQSIDVSSVRIRVLGGTATVAAQLHPSTVKNHDHDSALERHFKFDRAAVSALIGPPARRVVLEVFGNAQGCTFSGSDTIWFDPPGKGDGGKHHSSDEPQVPPAEAPADVTTSDAPAEPAPTEPIGEPTDQPGPEPSPTAPGEQPTPPGQEEPQPTPVAATPTVSSP